VRVKNAVQMQNDEIDEDFFFAGNFLLTQMRPLI
jgi:hypothetical protein